MTDSIGYYRHPTLHGDRVVFVCEDDLWSVSAGGGLARRLTASPGRVSFPVLSPDGARIAFTAQDEGPAEAFVMDADGGAARRLTWLGSMTRTVGWRRDGSALLFASDWRRPFKNYAHLYAIDPAGGRPVPLPHGPAQAISFQGDGPGVVLGRNSADPARWKRYRGGTAGTIWIDRSGAGKFAPLLRLTGNLACPMWIGARIYFLSDHEGYGNLYSCTPTGRGLRRHTHHEDFYVRYPSTDGARIVYHAGADLHVHDPATGESRRIDVRVHGHRSQRSRKFVSAAKHLESYDLHPQGHSLACVSRGGAFTLGLWDGAPSRHGAVPGARLRLARWMPDGERLVAVTDATGEESLVVLSPGGGKEKHVKGDFGRPIDLVPAPAGGDRVALSNHRHEVVVVDLTKKSTLVLERSDFDRIAGLAWSPDGKWLAYGVATTAHTSCLHLFEVATGRITAITRPDFKDELPAFDPDGRYLYFISWRVFDPVYDSHYFDLGFPKGARPCLLTLQRDAASPFSSTTRAPRGPLPASAEARRHGTEGAVRSKPAAKLEIDLDGIQDRIVALPVPEGRYVGIAATRAQILFSSLPVEGSLDVDWRPKAEPYAKGRLEAWDFEQDKAFLVADKVTSFELARDGKAVAVRSGNRIRVVGLPAAAKEAGRRDEPGRESGWVDLERIRVDVVPAEEWRQMYREAWRLQRDHFWTEDMSGVDWQAVHDRYLPLVERVASRVEFSDLLWEMQGELGTSHSYEMGGDYRPEPAWFQGFLGADVELDATSGTWRVTRIPRGDGWDAKCAPPLAAPGVGVREGDEILEVGGEPVGADVSPYERLVHRAASDVRLTVRSGDVVRRVAVRTLRDEYALRYRDWVETNRARVHEATKGRVGYVHIPDMGPAGYSAFHRSFLSEVEHDALVVDVRWNGGGHVSQLILEKLLRRRTAYGTSRWRAPYPYPAHSRLGPMVVLTNEYAGSDGDIFSHHVKIHRLGPLIGKRTWGGVVGIWPRHSLVDGTLTTQPEFANWFEDVGWRVENYGTDPDIEVEIRPQDHAAGRDTQLERAITEVSKLLRKAKPRVPEFVDRPRLAPPRLPTG